MMSYRKQYISYNVALQLLKKFKFMPCLSPDGYKPYHGHTDIRLFPWISRKDH